MQILRHIGLLLGAVIILLCAGCTSHMLRVATGSDEVEPIQTVQAGPDGGLELDVEAALGSFSSSDWIVHVPAEALEEAHRTPGVYMLDRSSAHEAGTRARDGVRPVMIGRLVEPFDWSTEEVAKLRGPEDVSCVVVCGDGASVLRFVHLRAEQSEAGDIGWSVAYLQLEPDEDGGAWWAWPLLPVTLACDAAGIVVAVIGIPLLMFSGAASGSGNLGDLPIFGGKL